MAETAEEEIKSLRLREGHAQEWRLGLEMTENSREVVLDILLTMEKEGEYSNQLIRATLDKLDYLPVQEKAFIKRVAEGTIERQIELDTYLDACSKVPVKKMKPFIRCLLRMSVYQLLYMDSVPDSAVCNEACKLAVKRKFQNLRGFVNGVLRNIARNKENLVSPEEMGLSGQYSMPEWIVELWSREYGKEITETILKGIEGIHPVSLRFLGRTEEKKRKELLRAFTQKGVVWEESPYLPDIYLLKKSAGIKNLPGYEGGAFTVQDASSALAVRAAQIKPGDFCIDACAAPGGKTILAAERAGRVLSRDVSPEKTEKIQENIERLQLSNVEVQVWDARVTDETMSGKADVLFLDVPCSGLGVMGKKRDIKYHVTPEGLAELEDLQKQIVDSCRDYLKPGGTLLYSTCTIDRQENEEMVKYISRELGFKPVSLEKSLPEKVWEEKQHIRQLLTECGLEKRAGLTEEEENACIQILPGFFEMDGFFIARFQKETVE